MIKMVARQKHLTWEINHFCNYNCVYCFLHGKEHKSMTSGNGHRSPEEWLAGWDRFNERFGPARIEIAGGEPFLYPGFLNILKNLSRKNRICVVTNFFWDLSDFVRLISPDNVMLVISMHPEYIGSTEEFFQKISLLRERGFKIVVTAVEYPPFIEKVRLYWEMCKKHGLPFIGTPFYGGYQGRQYPLAYTADEKESLRCMFANPKHAVFQFQELRTCGYPCNVGVYYARIYPDGTVKPCINALAMGNFMDKDFCFREKPVICPAPHCHCIPEFEYYHTECKGPTAL